MTIEKKTKSAPVATPAAMKKLEELYARNPKLAGKLVVDKLDPANAEKYYASLQDWAAQLPQDNPEVVKLAQLITELEPHLDYETRPETLEYFWDVENKAGLTISKYHSIPSIRNGRDTNDQTTFFNPLMQIKTDSENLLTFASEQGDEIILQIREQLANVAVAIATDAPNPNFDDFRSKA